MSQHDELMRKLEKKRREVLNSISQEPFDRGRFLALFEEEGKLIDELNQLITDQP